MGKRVINKPENIEQVREKMQEFGIGEEWFTADEFFYYYEAQAWMMKGAEIENWPALLHCWHQKRLRRVNNRRKRLAAASNTSTATASATSTAVGSNQPSLGGDGGGLRGLVAESSAGGDSRASVVSSWLDCQYPMPEEPEVCQEAERLERCYSLENQPQFGMYEHLKEILTSNTITLEAAVRRMGSNVVERIIIRHLDDLAAHFQTSLLSFSLQEMQQTARWMIEKSGWLKFSELMLICQRAKEERQLTDARVCRGDIKELVRNFSGWKRNTLEFL